MEVHRASPDPMQPSRKARDETLASTCLIPLAFSLASTPEHLSSNLGLALSSLCC